MLGWLLAALAWGGTAAAPGFSCWKQCGSRSFSCSWPPHGPDGNTTYLLTLCYASRTQCQQFKAGTGTTYTLNYRHVYVLSNATAWVEARWGAHVHRTPNLTLYLDKAVKLHPPPTGMPFTKTGGQLHLRVPRPPCHDWGQPPQREARFRRKGDRGWTQVTCESVTDENDSVTCALGRDGSFEVQLRHKLPHWSSYWSDWSSSIFVPEEILESPELSYQLGKLGRDGQRVLRLGWQRAPEEQGNVSYTLCARMLACRCAQPAEEDTVELGTEVTAHNLTLSGAEYEILLTAANAAGPGPVRELRVPAEQRSDLRFKDVSVAGSTVTARWEARSPGVAYCFEQQPLLPGASKQGICTQRDFPAKSIHVEKGALDTPACYRLAVHGWAPARGWSTFALQHHYSSNASLARPIHINASDATIVLQWSPSPRAACPGALAKYLICHVAKGDNVTYAEADAAASHFALQNLRPGTTYKVGVWEVTAESGRTCSTSRDFHTKALGNGWRPRPFPGPRGVLALTPKQLQCPRRGAGDRNATTQLCPSPGAVWKSNLTYLGILLALPAVATIYQLSKKRARRLLFPPLPQPVGTKAIQFSTGDVNQGQPRPGFVEPSERFSSADLLIMELDPGKRMADTSTRPGTPQPVPVAEEPVVVCPSGCEKELPFTYRRQEVLSPVGFPLPSSTGEEEEDEEEEEEEEEGRCGQRQPLVPIALLISDKPVIIRDEEGWDPSPEKSVP